MKNVRTPDFEFRYIYGVLTTLRSGKRWLMLVSLLSCIPGVCACTFPDPGYTEHAPGAGGRAGGASGSAGLVGSDGGTSGGGQCATACASRTVATGQGHVLAIAANAQRVEWITQLAGDNTSELRSAPSAGGEVSAIGSDGIGWSAYSLRTDETTAFIANQSPSGQILSMDLALGTLNFTYQQQDLDYLALSATTLFYSAPYALVRLPKDGPGGGGRLELTAAGPRLLALDGDFLIVLAQGETREPPRKVVRLRADGSQALSDAATLISDAPDFDSACVDASAYYFADAAAGKILRLPRTPGATATSIAEGESIPGSLQIRADTLYWITVSGKELRRVSSAGGEVSTLGKGQPGVLSADSVGVFWATPTGEIMAL